MKMKTKIEVDNATIVRFWLILIGIIAGLALIYWARQALIVIGVAAFLAVAINPLVTTISTKFFHHKRPLATAIVFFSFLMILVSFGFLVAPSLISQFQSFAETAPSTITSTIDSLHQNNFVKQFNLTSYIDEILNFINNYKQQWTTQLGSIMFNGFNSIIGFVASGFIILTLTFLMLVDAPEILRTFWQLYKNKRILERHQRIANKMAKTITGFVSGQLIEVSINGVCAGIAVFVLSLIFGIPTNLVLPVGLMVSLMGLIPLVGTTIGGILGAILIAFSNVSAGIVFMIYFVTYQQIENNIIAPFIQSRALRLSGLVVLIALTMGIYLFGILGAIISIPTAGCIKILLEENVDFAHETERS